MVNGGCKPRLHVREIELEEADVDMYLCMSMDNYANCTRYPNQLALSENTRLAYATVA